VKVVKPLLIAIVIYVGIVAAFESMIGILQPTNEATLVITTTDADGARADRVVARLETGGNLYVAANHWPRAWYRDALANPEVQITLDGPPAAYRAVPVSDEEHDRVDGEHDLGVIFRVVTGFPPRKILRLDPV
jgi:hypothetical protein